VKTGSDHYAALDGLRGAAALVVVVSHFSNETNMLHGAFGAGGGQLGVMLFFLISGFLMGSLYIETPPSAAEVLRFAQKRIARVIPLYLFVLAVSVAAFWMFGLNSFLYQVTLTNLPEHLLFIDGVSALWTIPVEMQFYAVFPLIWLLFASFGRTWTIVLLIVGGIGCAVTKQYGLLFCGHLFLIGVLVALVGRKPVPWLGASEWDAIFVVATIGTLASFPKITRWLDIPVDDPWKNPIVVIILSALLWSSIYSHIATFVLGGVVGRFIGEISYSIYLWHGPILLSILWLPAARSNIFVTAIFALATILSLAYVSFLLIERPLRSRINGVNLRTVYPFGSGHPVDRARM
jgi:peptidoglycan/LPS O-acetylase OafA/YrhL